MVAVTSQGLRESQQRSALNRQATSMALAVESSKRREETPVGGAASSLAFEAFTAAPETKQPSFLQRTLRIPTRNRVPSAGKMFKATSVEDVRKAVREYEERNRGIIDPRQAGFVQSWDVCMVLLLIFTALVTPYEVVFLPSTSEVNGLFVVNRLVDLAFLADMYVQFHLAFQSGSAHGSKWVLDRTEIRRHYMSWWFWIDLLSIAPLWILNFVLELDGEGGGVLGVSNSSGGLVLRASAEEGKSVSEMLQVVRMVRLLRLIKVARILKASKVRNTSDDDC